QGADVLTQDDPLDVALGEQVKNDDGHAVVHAERQGGVVHHRQPAVEHLEIGEVGEPLGIGVQQRIGGVDPVDLGRLEQHLGADLGGAQRGGGVGGEER